MPNVVCQCQPTLIRSSLKILKITQYSLKFWCRERSSMPHLGLRNTNGARETCLTKREVVCRSHKVWGTTIWETDHRPREKDDEEAWTTTLYLSRLIRGDINSQAPRPCRKMVECRRLEKESEDQDTKGRYPLNQKYTFEDPLHNMKTRLDPLL